MSLLGATGAEAETRTLTLYNTHTYERATITYKRNGKYLPDGLKKLNHFLRDWRRNEPTKMDPHLFDLVWDVYQKSGSRRPIHVVSGFRSLTTNNMLRRRSRGVAKFSQHTQGRAMDFFLPDVPLSKLRAICLRKQIGGCGYYPTSRSPFTHMDTARVRHWPRMTRKQLVKVFPNGRTLHVPTDGRPLPGYQQALADYKRRKRGQTIMVASAPATSRRPAARGGRGEAGTFARSDTSPTGKSRASAIFASLFGSDEKKTPPKDVGGTERKVASLNPRSGGTALPGVSAGDDEGSDVGTSRSDRPVDLVPKPTRRPRVLVASRETGGTETGSIYGAKGRKIDKSVFSSSRFAYADPSSGGEKASGGKDYRLASLSSTGIPAKILFKENARRMAATAPAIPLAKAPGMGFAAMEFGGDSKLKLLDGSTTTRRQAFGALYKPNPAGLQALLVKPSRAVNIRFGASKRRLLRTDRFTGPTVVAIRQVDFQ